MSQSNDDNFIHHNDNYFCYNNLNPTDDDAGLRCIRSIAIILVLLRPR